MNWNFCTDFTSFSACKIKKSWSYTWFSGSFYEADAVCKLFVDLLSSIDDFIPTGSHFLSFVKCKMLINCGILGSWSLMKVDCCYVLPCKNNSKMGGFFQELKFQKHSDKNLFIFNVQQRMNEVRYFWKSLLNIFWGVGINGSETRFGFAFEIPFKLLFFFLN